MSKRRLFTRKGSFLIFFSVLYVCAFSQRINPTITIKIDPDNRLTSDVAPFDKPFYILFPIDSSLSLENIRQINIYKLRYPRKQPPRYSLIKKSWKSLRKKINSDLNSLKARGKFEYNCENYTIDDIIIHSTVKKKKDSLINLSYSISCTSINSGTKVVLKMPDRKYKRYTPNILFSIRRNDFRSKITISDTPQIKGYKYLRILVPFVAPNTHIGVRVFRSITDKIFDTLNTINFQMDSVGDAVSKAAFELLASHQIEAGSLDSTLDKWLPFDNTEPNDFNPLSGSYKSLYNCYLKSKYDKLVSLGAQLQKDLEVLGKFLKKEDITPETILRCNCANELTMNELTSDKKGIATYIYNLILFKDSAKSLASGSISINDFGTFNNIPNYNVLQRIANLKALGNSMVSLNWFVNQSSFASLVSNGVKQEVYKNTTNILDRIKNNIKQLEDSYDDIKRVLFGKGELFGGDIAYASASPFLQDIKTSSGYYIIPDIGLAHITTIINNKANYVLRPYLGINVSFRAIDKSQSFHSIPNKNIWHHLSGVLGLTTYNMTQEGTSDLFKSMSLVTGIGVRFAKSARLTPAAFWYYRNNPNPVLSPKLSIAPSISLSLDLDVTNWFSTLSGKVF